MSRSRIEPSFEPVADWATGHAPAANTQATITRAAPGAGKRNVCTGFTVTFVAGASAPSAATLTVGVVDGATGSTTYLWGPARLGIPAVAGASNGIARGHLWLMGTANTAMTLEYSGAGGANTFLSVVLEGTVTTA